MVARAANGSDRKEQYKYHLSQMAEIFKAMSIYAEQNDLPGMKENADEGFRHVQALWFEERGTYLEPEKYVGEEKEPQEIRIR